MEIEQNNLEFIQKEIVRLTTRIEKLMGMFQDEDEVIDWDYELRIHAALNDAQSLKLQYIDFLINNRNGGDC